MISYLLTLTVVLGMTPDSLLQKVQERLSEIRDYTCTFESFEQLGNKTQDRTYEFKYLASGWIRMKIIKGDNKGAEVAYNPETKKVRAHKGGLLSAIKLTLDPSDKKVTSLRGYKITDAPFPALVTMLQEAIQDAGSVALQQKDEEWLLVIDQLQHPENFHGTSKFEVRISAQDLLPKEVLQYDADGNLIKRLTYWNIQINVGLTEEDFKM